MFMEAMNGFRQAGNRFLVSLKGLQLRALAGQYDNPIPTRFQSPHRLFPNSSTGFRTKYNYLGDDFVYIFHGSYWSAFDWWSLAMLFLFSIDTREEELFMKLQEALKNPLKMNFYLKILYFASSRLYFAALQVNNSNHMTIQCAFFILLK
jgi:hypothetical protein